MFLGYVVLGRRVSGSRLSNFIMVRLTGRWLSLTSAQFINYWSCVVCCSSSSWRIVHCTFCGYGFVTTADSFVRREDLLCHLPSSERAEIDRQISKSKIVSISLPTFWVIETFHSWFVGLGLWV